MFSNTSNLLLWGRGQTIKENSHSLRVTLEQFCPLGRRGSAGSLGEGRTPKGKSGNELLSLGVGELCEHVVLPGD